MSSDSPVEQAISQRTPDAPSDEEWAASWVTRRAVVPTKGVFPRTIEAVESIPDSHPDHAMFLNRLRNALQSRFEKTGSMEDLERAIVTKEQAVELIPYTVTSKAI